MFNFRTLADVVRNSGLGPLTLMFVLLFFICSVIVWIAEPTQNTFGDGVWFCFQVVSTIGFGDIDASDTITRITSIILSIVSIFYVAIITGVVVSYITENLKLRRGEMLANFAANLERVDKMSPQELKEFAENVRKYRRNHNQ